MVHPSICHALLIGTSQNALGEEVERAGLWRNTLVSKDLLEVKKLEGKPTNCVTFSSEKSTDFLLYFVTCTTWFLFSCLLDLQPFPSPHIKVKALTNFY